MASQTGKTNARHIRVYLDDVGASARDISASVSNISGVGLVFDEQNVTCYSDGVVNFVLGHPSSEIEITGPYSDTADIGAHIVFSNRVGYITTTATLTVQIGILAAPLSTDPEFEGEYFVSSYLISGDGTYTARLVPASATVPAWGAVA